MAELTITTFLTLDGVMQAPGGPTEDPSGDFPHGGWLVPFADADFESIMAEIFTKVDAFLLGRRTYDIFAAYWPRITDPEDPIAGKLNGLPKYVASRSQDRFDWNGALLIPDPVNQLPQLKERFEREIQMHGSGDLAQDLMAADLIDEYRLITFPVLLGTGKRLFDRGAAPATLTLVETRVTGAGAVYSVYRRAGPVTTGSFTLDSASPR